MAVALSRWPLVSSCFSLLVMSFRYCSVILVISPSCIVKLTLERGIFVVRNDIFVVFGGVFHRLMGHFFHDFVTFGAKMSC